MKVCESCGTKNSDSRSKCEECGGNLRQLEDWEIPKEKRSNGFAGRVVLLAVIILALVGVGVFIYMKNYVVDLGGADSPEELITEYMKAYDELDFDTCLTYLSPYEREVNEMVKFDPKGYNEEFIGVEITDYTDEELKRIKNSYKDVTEACYIAVKYQVEESPYQEAGVETIYATALKYKDKWFISNYGAYRK